VSPDEIATLAESFFAAIEAGDLETVRRLYASDAVVWHNFDNLEQTVDDNLAVLAWMVRTVADRQYDEVRRIIVDDGFVQQHVLRGKAPGGRLEMPAMMRVVVADGRVTRVEEYLDSAHAAVLRRTQAPAPSADP
jgi:ketosteroid isomerase-like protein